MCGIVGYVGSFEASWREVLVWNLQDYAHRLQGRFRNERGAHAGFSPAEWRGLLTSVAWDDVQDVTLPYLAFKYRWSPLLRLGRLGYTVAPALYAWCRKPG